MTSTAEEPAAKGDHAKQRQVTILAAHAREDSGVERFT